jgi:hypothetical protein
LELLLHDVNKYSLLFTAVKIIFSTNGHDSSIDGKRAGQIDRGGSNGLSRYLNSQIEYPHTKGPSMPRKQKTILQNVYYVLRPH